LNNNLATAKIELEKYWQKDKNNQILIDSLGYIYKQLKSYKEAIKLYSRALEINPESIYYTLELIDLLIDDKNYVKAMDLIKEFSSKHDNCASIYNSLARIYYRLNELNPALENVSKALSLDINNSETNYFKGLILNDLGEFEEAKKNIYNAIKINPMCAKYYFQMAKSYNNLKEYESALLYSKEAIELDPNEINYKKQAYDISLNIGNIEKIAMYKKQLERSEKILKLKIK